MSSTWISPPPRRWPDEDGPYLVRVHLDTVAGRRGCVGLEMWGETPPVVGVPVGELNALRDLAAEVIAGGPGHIRKARDLALAVEWLSTRFAPAELPSRTEITTERQRLPLRQLVQDALVEARKHVLSAQAVEGDELSRATEPLRYLLDEDRQPGGRPPYGDDFYREVAAFWLSALEGGSDRPTSDLAEHYRIEKSTAGKWVQRCRQLDPPLLPPAPGRGRLARSEGDAK